MNTIAGDAIRSSLLDKHAYICDLINIEGPLLSLFRDNRSNWCYLWCDTDGKDTERWAVIYVLRSTLAGYLNQQTSLRDLLNTSSTIYCLDITTKIEDGARVRHRRLKRVNVSALEQYWPAEDSFFDPSLTEDISLTQEITPTRYHVPIDGEWFISDLDRFARTYDSVYAFFYCTKPRFVTNIQDKVHRLLRSPWTGGFSRINLFDALGRTIPSIHDTKINKFTYASPGSIQIEGLRSVGDNVSNAIRRHVANHVEIAAAVKAINVCFISNKVRKADLSSKSDAVLSIAQESVALLKAKCQEIAQLLDIEDELAVFVLNAPNTVVAAKATLALVTQLEKLAGYQQCGMLDLARAVPDDEM
ncbi:MAG: hypothetical protein QM749_19720 [Aquabacterium sp.]